jgi:oxalate decarboxylase/phosphoglucose isomerase-like protein (cupin superfamily)
MQHVNVSETRREFDIVLNTGGAQAATMILKAGTASDDQPSNEHPQCEQWLFVISGSGEAIVGKSRQALRHVALRKNSLVVIEKGELHQIKNTGNTPMRTINFYVPPAYESDGEPKPQAKNRHK